MKRRVTIETVAKACGVSKMAVSYALRGSAQVSVPLRETILKAARKLGYVPSRAARSLNGRMTPRIGIVLPLPGSPVHARNLQALDEACRLRGVETAVRFHYWHPEAERRILQSLLDDGVTGLVLGPAGRETGETLSRLQEAGLSAPLVTFGSLHGCGDTLEGYLGNCGPDYPALAALCLRHLAGHGHRNIALLFQGPRVAKGSSSNLARSFLAAARRIPEIRLELFYLDDSSSPVRQKILRGEPCAFEDVLETGDQLACHFLNHPFEATVAIASDDLSALSLLNECLRRNIGVPRDLSILSLDGSSLCRMAALPLAHAAPGIGEVAARVVARLLDSPAGPREEMAYGLSIVPGATLANRAAAPKARQGSGRARSRLKPAKQ